MSTDIKPGQIWQWNSDLPHEGGLVVTKTEGGNVHYRYEDESVKGEFHRDTEYFTGRAHPVTDIAPPDPSKVKAGDTVTVVVSDEKHPQIHVTGEVYEGFPGDLAVGPHLLSRISTVITAHQPAPEPEPEWKPGTVGMATVRGVADTQVMRTSEDNWISPGFVKKPTGVASRLHFDGDVTDVRPLVVIDPAKVDLNALNTAALNAYMDDSSVMTADGVRAAVGAVLAHLGIEAS